MSAGPADRSLLERFRNEIKSSVPHVDGGDGSTVVNATPLEDLTEALLECAKTEYGLDIRGDGLRVMGKFEAGLPGGSIKTRAAVQIIEDAIATGRLSRERTVFEATSGNFGIALGLLGSLDLRSVVLVSRRLQEGVLDELRNGNVRTVNLDVDICPAPGLARLDQDILVAKVVAENMRGQLAQLGLDPSRFDAARDRVEDLLAGQDVINLAKLLARVYDGFCPEQYDNGMNVKAHEEVTGPEVDQQLRGMGLSLGDFSVVCTFGTGGTSTGLGRYVQRRYGKRSVHVVFPLNGQDVAGIRSKDKALGLRFYEPGLYAGEHAADFEEARRLMRFFVGKGYDLGESGALALYAVLQMVNFGAGDRRFVVVLPDGMWKYRRGMDVRAGQGPLEVSLQQASSSIGDYAAVLWTHSMFSPRDAGLKLIASSLGCEEEKVRVVSSEDVNSLLATRRVPEGMGRLLPAGHGRLLLVCVSGTVSTRVAHLLSEKGVGAQSLNGGITPLCISSGKPASELVKYAGD